MPRFYGDIIADFCRKIKGQTPQKKLCKILQSSQYGHNLSTNLKNL